MNHFNGLTNIMQKFGEKNKTTLSMLKKIYLLLIGYWPEKFGTLFPMKNKQI